jgi:predicted nucleic acid-binding protein
MIVLDTNVISRAMKPAPNPAVRAREPTPAVPRTETAMRDLSGLTQ